MKKTIKRILIGISIVIILLVLFFVGYGYKAQSEIKTMTPLESGEIVENIFVVKDSYTNLYLIKDSLNYIAIDAGNKIEVIAEELEIETKNIEKGFKYYIENFFLENGISK